VRSCGDWDEVDTTGNEGLGSQAENLNFLTKANELSAKRGHIRLNATRGGLLRVETSDK